jgi:uncharacterized membrane protein YdbT with pleckstrin-like domain
VAIEFVVRPSLRRAKFFAVLCVGWLLFVLWAWWALVPVVGWWILIAGAIPFLAPISGWLNASRTSLTVGDGLVRYKHGFVTQTTLALELRKLQDIRVVRSLMQRTWGIGTLILETAGEVGQVVLADIDNPQEVADRILSASKNEGRA